MSAIPYDCGHPPSAHPFCVQCHERESTAQTLIASAVVVSAQAHWCPDCPESAALEYEKSVHHPELGELHIFRCRVHGGQHHDSNADDFCWCEK